MFSLNGALSYLWWRDTRHVVILSLVYSSCSCALCRPVSQYWGAPWRPVSHILLTFPHVENSCEIIHLTWFSWSSTLCRVFSMITMLWSVKYARKWMDFSPLVSESHPRRFACQVGFGDLWWEKSISHGKPYKMHIFTVLRCPLKTGFPVLRCPLETGFTV